MWSALVAILLLVSGLVMVLPAVVARDGAAFAGVVARAENPTTRAARLLAGRITGQLDRQSAALLAGDRAGFLAIAEPAVHADLRRRFTTLRALQVTGWEARPSGLPTEAGRPGEWRLTVEFRYCFVVPDCRTSSVLVETRWRGDRGEPRLLALAGSRTETQLAGRAEWQAEALPWEVSELVVAVGGRTLVATTPALRKRLPDLLARAEAAAKVADRYVVTGSRPDRYRIYYAGPKEWKRWYGGDLPGWAAGYAIGIGGGHRDIVVRAGQYTDTAVDELLRHELAHAASLPDNDRWDESAWWLVEGLAEYVASDGRSISRYDGLSATRRLVNRGWNGKLDSVAPADDASPLRVAGNYGISYLAVSHLVARFGEERVFAFVKAVIHDLRIPRQTAEEIFGQPWSTIHDGCVAYIRDVAG
ncbi:hypothetical protein HCJ94_05345 [Micromonospora sp. HSS6-12]|uniref:Peptidase MA superfamily n=1 Tax=Micromonospora thermarum TaxID=2720024 RepID=A0ABX0Z5U7_9ACTN|nr:hypothetical protein [Micromonospora thermarum]